MYNRVRSILGLLQLPNAQYNSEAFSKISLSTPICEGRYILNALDEKWGLWEIYQCARCRLVVSYTRVFPCSELRYRCKPRYPGWYTTLWALARYASTKRLNEHLRTPRQSRVNRTWLILSRKICGGRLPRADSYFFSPIFSTPLLALPAPHPLFFHNATANMRDERSRRGSKLFRNFVTARPIKAATAAPSRYR